MDLIFSPAVMDIVKELEEDFKDNGNRHYPRLLLLGIVLYCFKQKDYKYNDRIKRVIEESELFRGSTKRIVNDIVNDYYKGKL